MRTLNETIDRMSEGVGQTLRKHLSAVGINEWDELTRSALYELKDHLSESLAPNSQKTIMANLKSIMNRVKDEVDFPVDYAKILTVKATKPMKIYLSEEDLAKLEHVSVHTKRQEFVKNVFLICAYTGLRVGDAMNLTTQNIVGGSLHYIAQKTKKVGAIPLKSGLAERIAWVEANKEYRVTLMGYNRSIRKMCKDAGINEEVMVFKAGKEQKGPKWQFVSSHTARISTASCLNKRGVGIGDICTLLQHSGTSMTERYIIRDHVELSPTAMKFFA